MRIAVVVVSLLLLPSPALAQDPIPDTTSAWRYYPLNVGDIREYSERISFPCDVCFYIAVEEVTGDTLIAGILHYIVDVATYEALGPPYPPPSRRRHLVRFDEDEARLEGLLFSDHGGCRLDEAFPPVDYGWREVECSLTFSGYGLVGGGYDQEVTIGDDTFTATAKDFDYFTSFSGKVVRFVADVGLVEYEDCEGSCFTRTLRYARVGGVEYGEPLALSSEPASPHPGFALSVSPNPTRGTATLTLTVPVPQTVTVEAFDALGRRVYGEAHAASATTTLRLDSRRWKPGVYAVRVTAADGATATARLVCL